MHHRVATIALSMIASALSVSAQQPDSVRTAGTDSTGVLALDPLLITISKLPLAASRTGFAVSVVGDAQIRAERPALAADALRPLAGVFIDEAVGPGGPTIIRLRGGEEVFTQILMDGVQVNENGGFFDFQGVTLGNIERIEVARGPQSALYGSSAVSGVVQFITRPGQQGPLRIGGIVEGGSGVDDWPDNYRATLNARGGSSRLLYSASGGVAYDRGIYDLPSDTRTRDASLRIDATPSARWQVDATARYIVVESMQPVRDAGATRVPLDPNARLERNRFVAKTGIRFLASGSTTHSLRASVFRQDFFFADRTDGITQPDDFFVPDFTFDFESDLTRTTLEYVGQIQSSRITRDTGLRLAFGGLLEREDLSTDQTGDFGDSSVQLDRSSAALFADVHAAPHADLALLAGARVEYYDGVGAEWTPRASLVWNATRRLALRAATGRAYKVPNLQEQYIDNAFIASNPDLEPETSVSFEAGADIDVAARARLSLTAFSQSFRNLIRTVAIDGDTRTQNRNVGRSRARGVEVSFDVSIGSAIETGADVTRSWTRVLDNTGLPVDQYPVDEPLPFRPDWTVTGFVRATPGSFDVVGRATWIGEQTVLSERFSGDRVALDGYMRFDAAVSYHFAPRRTVFIRIDNVLDSEYSTAFDRRGRPRSARIGFEIGD